MIELKLLNEEDNVSELLNKIEEIEDNKVNLELKINNLIEEREC